MNAPELLRRHRPRLDADVMHRAIDLRPGERAAFRVVQLRMISTGCRAGARPSHGVASKPGNPLHRACEYRARWRGALFPDRDGAQLAAAD